MRAQDERLEDLEKTDGQSGALPLAFEGLKGEVRHLTDAVGELKEDLKWLTRAAAPGDRPAKP